MGEEQSIGVLVKRGDVKNAVERFIDEGKEDKRAENKQRDWKVGKISSPGT